LHSHLIIFPVIRLPSGIEQWVQSVLPLYTFERGLYNAPYLIG